MGVLGADHRIGALVYQIKVDRLGAFHVGVIERGQDDRLGGAVSGTDREGHRLDTKGGVVGGAGGGAGGEFAHVDRDRRPEAAAGQAQGHVNRKRGALIDGGARGQRKGDRRLIIVGDGGGMGVLGADRRIGALVYQINQAELVHLGDVRRRRLELLVALVELLRLHFGVGNRLGVFLLNEIRGAPRHLL